MISWAFSPAIPSIGSAQKGCSKFVQASPQATAIAKRATSAPSASDMLAARPDWVMIAMIPA